MQILQTYILIQINKKIMEKDQQNDKNTQQILNYLRHRVLPILEPLQMDILTQRPTNIKQFAFFWLQNFKQQQNRQQQVSSDDQMPEEVYKQRMRQKKNNKKRKGISGEVYSAVKAQQANKSYSDKCQEDKIKMLIKLRNHIFFRNLSEQSIQQIIKCMKTQIFKAGEVVIRQGDTGNQLYLVDEGLFSCEVEQNADQNIQYGPGQAFGELALLYNTKRASTITAETDGKLFSLDRISFNATLRDNVLKKTRICDQILNKNPKFSTMNPYQKCKLIQNLKEISFPAGKYVIKQGQIGDRFYIVKEGKLVAQKAQSNGEIKSVMYYKQGDYFGQLALIQNKKRQASIKTLTSSKLLYMERSTFKRILGSFQQILRRGEEKYRIPKQEAKISLQ